MPKQPCVYILASKRNGTLYTGVTSDLVKRVWEHQHNLVEGFTGRYGVHTLVYFEQHDDMEEAIRREKQLKKWNRAWKIALIERHNPEWEDLWSTHRLGLAPRSCRTSGAKAVSCSFPLDSRLRPAGMTDWVGEVL